MGIRSRAWRRHHAELPQRVEVVGDAALPAHLAVTNLENDDLFAGCAAMSPRTPARDADPVERNKALVRELTEVVWSQRGLDRIPDFYGPEFVGDYRPYGLRQGHEGVRASVADAWTAFPEDHEDLLELIGEGDRVFVHLAISGPQRGQWGPGPPTPRSFHGAANAQDNVRREAPSGSSCCYCRLLSVQASIQAAGGRGLRQQFRLG